MSSDIENMKGDFTLSDAECEDIIDELGLVRKQFVLSFTKAEDNSTPRRDEDEDFETGASRFLPGIVEVDAAAKVRPTKKACNSSTTRIRGRGPLHDCTIALLGRESTMHIIYFHCIVTCTAPNAHICSREFLNNYLSTNQGRGGEGWGRQPSGGGGERRSRVWGCAFSLPAFREHSEVVLARRHHWRRWRRLRGRWQRGRTGHDVPNESRQLEGPRR